MIDKGTLSKIDECALNGYTNKQIAKMLFISLSTVKRYRTASGSRCKKLKDEKRRKQCESLIMEGHTIKEIATEWNISKEVIRKGLNGSEYLKRYRENIYNMVVEKSKKGEKSMDIAKSLNVSYSKVCQIRRKIESERC